MVMISQDFFLKNRLAVMKLARDFIVTEPEQKLQTIDEYIEKFNVSRGTVQAAILFLIDQNCISTKFKGHLGTYLLSKNQDKLWEYSGFGSLSGAMSLPLNTLVSGFATGICQCMKTNHIPFNSVFVQGSNTRIKGLAREKYDFIVASRLTEIAMLHDYPNVEKIMELPGCAYGGEYVLLFSDISKDTVEDNMVIAIDPTSVDQMFITNFVCKDKRNIRYNELTYINTRLSVLNGESDVTVTRLDTIQPEHWPKCKKLVIPGYSTKYIESFTNSIIFALKSNYGVGSILRHSLQADVISQTQQKVISGKLSESYY